MTAESTAESSARSGVDLYWIPLGAGAHVVRLTGALYERMHAARGGRAPRQIYHSALVVHSPSGPVVIEQAPAARHGEERGVVVVGPVGIRAMVCWPLPRYEVRCWPDGCIDDLDEATNGPVRLTDDAATALAVVGCAPDVPAHTWGRILTGTPEMWNSNSVVAWILQRSGLDAAALSPPGEGLAPGWASGCIEERRSGSTPHRPVAGGGVR